MKLVWNSYRFTVLTITYTSLSLSGAICALRIIENVRIRYCTNSLTSRYEAVSDLSLSCNYCNRRAGDHCNLLFCNFRIALILADIVEKLLLWQTFDSEIALDLQLFPMQLLCDRVHVTACGFFGLLTSVHNRWSCSCVPVHIITLLQLKGGTRQWASITTATFELHVIKIWIWKTIIELQTFWLIELLQQCTEEWIGSMTEVIMYADAVVFLNFNLKLKYEIKCAVSLTTTSCEIRSWLKNMSEHDKQYVLCVPYGL
jgi:hypothetical protein